MAAEDRGQVPEASFSTESECRRSSTTQVPVVDPVEHTVNLCDTATCIITTARVQFTVCLVIIDTGASTSELGSPGQTSAVPVEFARHRDFPRQSRRAATRLEYLEYNSIRI